jgi:bifunctional enzyme CysN/CysC/sulfate adenylyltransferase subunit 1
MVLPSLKKTRVVAIDAGGEELPVAFAPMSVALRLADEIDVSRGDMIVHTTNVPRVARRLDAMVVWLHERPLDPGKSYLLKHTTQTVRAEVEAVRFQVDLETLENVPATSLGLNDIGRVTLATHRPLFVDAYSLNRATGAFILVDSLTNDTVAAGMILAADGGAARRDPPAPNGGDRTHVSPDERRVRLGHGAAALVVKGDRARAYAVERELFDRGVVSVVVSGDVAVAEACLAAGVIAVCSVDERGAAQLEGRLGSERVVDGGEDVESAIRSLVVHGVLGDVAR